MEMPVRIRVSIYRPRSQASRSVPGKRADTGFDDHLVAGLGRNAVIDRHCFRVRVQCSRLARQLGEDDVAFRDGGVIGRGEAHAGIGDPHAVVTRRGDRLGGPGKKRIGSGSVLIQAGW